MGEQDVDNDLAGQSKGQGDKSADEQKQACEYLDDEDRHHVVRVYQHTGEGREIAGGIGGCGMKCRKPSPPKTRNSKPSRMRATRATIFKAKNSGAD